jgi:hypothetical protein
MSNARFFSAIAFTAVVALVAGLTLARPAQADTPRTAVCINSLALKKGDGDFAGTGTRWMQEQLSAGKTDFVTLPTSNGSVVACAW